MPNATLHRKIELAKALAANQQLSYQAWRQWTLAKEEKVAVPLKALSETHDAELWPIWDTLIIATERAELDSTPLSRYRRAMEDRFFRQPLCSAELLSDALDILRRLEARLADEPGEVTDTAARIPHSAAFAMLKLDNKTAKEASKIMRNLRDKAGTLLDSKWCGNHYEYNLASWRAVVKLISKAGGIDKYTDPSPAEIESRAVQIRAEKNRR